MASPVARPLFTATIFIGSFMLFLVQPMVARMALPRLGGAPNVWNSAMLVYQALLLAGYAYAHLLSRLPLLRQAAIQLGVLLIAAITLPIAMPAADLGAEGMEALWVPWLFVLTIGPLFFAVSAQAPLVQKWFAGHPQASDPYPLYAASNLGSFAGLLTYPLLAEPLLPLDAQSTGWAIGYGTLILLVAMLAWSRRAIPSEAAPFEGAPLSTLPTRRTYLRWLALAAVPSGLLLSTSTHLTTDIFAMPLLWVLPLGLYLLSFSIAFARARWLADLLSRAAPVVLTVCGALTLFAATQRTVTGLLADLVLLLVVSVALHSRMFESRPAPDRLTAFYLTMSAGGVIGGIFTALVAPLVFDWTWEHPLLIVASALLIPLARWTALLKDRAARLDPLRLAAIALIAAAFLLRTVWPEALPLSERQLDWAIFVPAALAPLLLATRRVTYVAAVAVLMLGLCMPQLRLSLAGARERSYFGIYTVRDDPGGTRTLVHGTTVHGIQRLAPGKSLEPTAYYGLTAGVGKALLASGRLFGSGARVGVVGLGVGTLACYRRPGQVWTFYEIDPAIVAYSNDGRFTFVQRCAPDAELVVGDARLKLESEPPNRFDILVVDAFTSDAIPLHLLTEEAYRVYFRALDADGLLLVHISNHFIDLEPIVAGLARSSGAAAVLRADVPAEPDRTPSVWVAMSRDPTVIERLVQGDEASWRQPGEPSHPVWRDNYASVLPHIRWDELF